MVRREHRRTCLVTGGAGFVGSHLVHALLARGDRVRVLDDLSTGTRSNLAAAHPAEALRITVGDILDASVLDAAMRDVDVVFHEAAVASVPRSVAQPMESHEVNATGTLRVLEAARRAGVRRVVYAGSCSAYGDAFPPPQAESMVPAPLSPYAAAKLAGEHYAAVYARTYGLQTVSLRYFNVFGPRQDPRSEYAAVIPRFIVSALGGTSPVIFGDGAQSRDFCFVDNVVEANLRAADADAQAVSGRFFNVGCGKATSLNEVVALLGGILGHAVVARHEAARPGDIRHSYADITEARAALGYLGAAEFGEGLRRTVAWFRDHGPAS